MHPGSVCKSEIHSFEFLFWKKTKMFEEWSKTFTYFLWFRYILCPDCSRPNLEWFGALSIQDSGKENVEKPRKCTRMDIEL